MSCRAILNSAFYIILSILFSINTEAQPLSKIRIDPAQAYGGTVSEYFDSMEYIPLETTKESLFGDVFKLAVLDSSIVVFDNDTRCLLFFSSSGNYIKKVLFKLEDISIFTVGNKVGVRVYNKIKQTSAIKYYSSKGVDLKQDKIYQGEYDDNPPVYLDEQFSIKGNTCYFPIGKKVIDSTYNLLSVFRNGKFVKGLLPVNQRSHVGFCALMGGVGDLRTCLVRNEAMYICTGKDFLVYKVTRDTAQPVFSLVFPASRTYPAHYFDTTLSSQEIDEYRRNLVLNTDLIRSVSNVFFGKKTMHFRIDPAIYINSSGSDYNRQFNFIYNIEAGRLFSLERIVPDQTNFYLPILEPIKIAMNGLYIHNDFFYSIVPSFQMFSSFEKNKSKNPQYPPVLQEYFKTQNRKSNPVIVRMKLRE